MDYEAEDLPDGMVLGILIYDTGMCMVRSRVPPEVAAQVLRDMASALENGQQIVVNLN